MAVVLSLGANASAVLTNQYRMDDNDNGSVLADSVGASPATFKFTPQPTMADQHSANSKEGTGSILFDNVLSATSAAGSFGLPAVGGGWSYTYWFNPTSGYNAGTSFTYHLENSGAGGVKPRTTSGWLNRVTAGRLTHIENNITAIQSTSNTWTAGMWYHVAYTIQADAASDTNGEVKIYINGELDNTNPSTALVDGTHGVVNIGGHPNESGTLVSSNALLDDWRFYDHALSPEEVREIFPEPASLALLSLGGLAMLGRRRRA